MKRIYREVLFQILDASAIKSQGNNTLFVFIDADVYGIYDYHEECLTSRQVGKRIRKFWNTFKTQAFKQRLLEHGITEFQIDRNEGLLRTQCNGNNITYDVISMYQFAKNSNSSYFPYSKEEIEILRNELQF